MTSTSFSARHLSAVLESRQVSAEWVASPVKQLPTPADIKQQLILQDSLCCRVSRWSYRWPERGEDLKTHGHVRFIRGLTGSSY